MTLRLPTLLLDSRLILIIGCATSPTTDTRSCWKTGFAVTA